MRTLTRAEAGQRSALLDVTSYDVVLDLTRGPERFGTETVVTFGCREPGASTFLELDVPGEVLVEGAAAERTGSRLLLSGLAERNTVRVVAEGAYSRAGAGLHRFVDPADGAVYVWAQSFLDDAQRVFACFDQPDLKAVVRLRVLAPDGARCLANGAAELVDGQWRFAPTPPLATYLVSLVAGPWEGVERVVNGTTLGVWCRRSLREHLDADELLDVTGAVLQAQERRFAAPYPFGPRYDQVFVPEFNHGAMENPGCVLVSEDLLFRSRVTRSQRRRRAETVAHELAHMWFGDLVTMRWWDDLWLNESFAELMGISTVAEATGFDGGWAHFCLVRKAWGYRADAAPTTHPVSGDVADTRSALLNFDGISYAKGASVLRQLAATIGPEVFDEGVRSYLAQHAWGSTSWLDLLAHLSRTAGRDLTSWADAWLRTSGTSVLSVVRGPEGVEVRQDAEVLREHRLRVSAYADDGGRLVLSGVDVVDLRGRSAPAQVPGGADLLLPNDGDLTFATVHLDERSQATALARVRDLDDPLTRAVVWGALVSALRDGRLAAAEMVPALLHGMQGEDDPEVVAALLAVATSAATGYTGYTSGERLREAVADACAATLQEGRDADRLLVHARGLCGAATAAHVPLLAGLRDGSAVPSGLVVDPDLRWLVVLALARLGALSEAHLDEEAARDRTAAGSRAAARARAARPTPEAKEEAWSASVSDLALSNHEATALAEGLWQPGQETLLRPYVGRYVREVVDIWHVRPPELARALTLRLFPSTLVEQGTLTEVDALLARWDVPAGCRRVVLEQRDDLRRALRGRALGASDPVVTESSSTP